MVKNAFWLTIGEIVSRFFRFFVVVYAARVLGASGWGTFSYALSIAGLIMIFSDLGLNAYTTRELSQNNPSSSALVSTAFFLKIFVLLVSTLLVLIIGSTISKLPEANHLLIWVALILFFDSLRDFGFAFIRAFNKMEWQTFSIAIMSVIVLVLGLFLLHKNPAPISVAIAYLVGGFVGCIAIFWVIRNNVLSAIGNFRFDLVKPILKISVTFAFTSLLGNILANSDVYMLGLWRTPAEIGFYAAGQRFYQFFLVIPSTISMALFPTLSRYGNDLEKSKVVLQKTMNVVLAIGIPIAFGGIILAHDIIIKILGVSYAATIPIFQVLMIMTVLSFPSMILSNAIFAQNEQKKLLVASATAAIVNIILNVFLIARLGALGAAISTLISLCVAILLMATMVKKIVNLSLIRGVGKLLLAGIVMSICCLLLQALHVYFIITILVGGVIYVMSLILLKASIVTEIKEFLSSQKI